MRINKDVVRGAGIPPTTLTLQESIRMTIYRTKRTKVNYRKIYEDHYGKIPIDSDGRKYDVHHIDGDCHNNNPSNLVALSISDHYDVHKSMRDWSSCFAIALRMKKSPDELSILQRRKVEDGTHHLLTGEIQKAITKKRIEDGTHNFLKTGSEAVAYKDRKFTFFNKTLGLTVVSTQYDLIRNYNLHEGNLSSVVSGRRKSTGGWQLLVE